MKINNLVLLPFRFVGDWFWASQSLRAFPYLRRWHRGFQKISLEQSLLFYGPPGLGKTFLCTSIAKALMDNSKTVLYYSSSELFNRLSDYTFSRETFLKTSSKEIHDLIMDTQLLIIDDLGSEMTNSFVINQLFNILNLREMHARKLIISTNLTPKELNEVYGDRIFSRMVMHFDFYKFYGSDIRWKL